MLSTRTSPPTLSLAREQASRNVVRRRLRTLPLRSITIARSAPPAAIVLPATIASWYAPNAAITSVARTTTDLPHSSTARVYDREPDTADI